MELRLDGVTRSEKGARWLDAVSAALAPGMHVVLGRTSAGKTTLLRVLAGLDRPQAGRVLAGSEDVTRVPVQERGVAFVYEQFVNYPSFTVRENIATPLRIAGYGTAAVEKRVGEVAAMLHLEELLDRLPAELSGGQQQRVAIARALVKDVPLLLLDEPLGNLDFKLREELRREVKALVAERATRGAVVVWATSDPLEALEMGGTVHVLHEGRIVQSGPVLDVWRRPASETVAAVFDDPPMVFLDAEIADGEVRLPGAAPFRAPAHLAALAPGRWRIGVRADHLRTSRVLPSDPALEAIVELEEVTGSETLLHARVAGTSVVAREPGVAAHRLGERVSLFLRADRVLAFDPSGALAASPAAATEPSPG